MASSTPTATVFVLGTAAPGPAVEAFLSAAQLSLQHVQFACSSEATAPTTPACTHALLAASPDKVVSSQTLSSLSRSLAPGAALYVYDQDASKLQQLQKELLLGGFLEAQTVEGTQLVCARKPSWEVGAKSALKLKRPASSIQQQLQQQPQPAAGAWKLSAADDMDELVDEDELLTEEDRAAKPAVAASDCSTSRKACKNCSCGRAEAEAAGEKVQLTQEMLDNPKTNCGSCALGDAFRCAGCPYRGLPAFEPGKKITLASNFLTADA